MRNAFTLVELLVVIAIVSLLATILFPVFSNAREKGRQATCLSNLRQLCQSTFMYAQDADDLYPYGGDPSDIGTNLWADTPYAEQADQVPLLPGVLAPYIASPALWHCPSDTGYDYGGAFEDAPINGRPTAYGKFGMSYAYRTELAFAGKTVGDITTYDQTAPHREYGPAEVLLFEDMAGDWHGEEKYSGRKYHAAFCDGHARLITRAQDDDFWHQTLTPPK